MLRARESRRRRSPEGNRAAPRPARRSSLPGSRVQRAPGTAAANGRSLRGAPDRFGSEGLTTAFSLFQRCKSSLMPPPPSLVFLGPHRNPESDPMQPTGQGSAFCTVPALRAMTRNVA